jgi:hypothetical protein
MTFLNLGERSDKALTDLLCAISHSSPPLV